MVGGTKDKLLGGWFWRKSRGYIRLGSNSFLVDKALSLYSHRKFGGEREAVVRAIHFRV